jgi:predicted esterase
MPLLNPERRHLEVARTARYFTIGRGYGEVTDLWFAVHGYGQLAADFAKPFRRHSRDGRLIVVPEGLSRFYVSNRERVMGASWMTAEDRKMEIRDYVAYLNALYDRLLADGVPPGAPLSVLAFSQGSATATRWLADGHVRADRLVLWGGLPAFELCDETFQLRVPAGRIDFVAGTNDRYVSPSRQQELRPTLSKNGVEISCHTFEGGHELDEATLARIMDREGGPEETDGPAEKG